MRDEAAASERQERATYVEAIPFRACLLVCDLEKGARLVEVEGEGDQGSSFTGYEEGEGLQVGKEFVDEPFVVFALEDVGQKTQS